jgi:hypothetical protein
MVDSLQASWHNAAKGGLLIPDACEPGVGRHLPPGLWRERARRLHLGAWQLLLLGLMLVGIGMTVAGSFQST